MQSDFFDAQVSYIAEYVDTAASRCSSSSNCCRHSTLYYGLRVLSYLLSKDEIYAQTMKCFVLMAGG